MVLYSIPLTSLRYRKSRKSCVHNIVRFCPKSLLRLYRAGFKLCDWQPCTLMVLQFHLVQITDLADCRLRHVPVQLPSEVSDCCSRAVVGCILSNSCPHFLTVRCAGLLSFFVWPYLVGRYLHLQRHHWRPLPLH